MAALSQTWFVFTAVTLLAVQLSIGESSCVTWSPAGSVVQRGSSFKVYCTFYCRDGGSMFSDHPPKLQSHEVLNSTTIYMNVVNITRSRTFSCKCNEEVPYLDPCGLDISAGYPPDPPKNISCIHKVMNNATGVLFCAWNRGRDTYLGDTHPPLLWVRSVFANYTDKPVSYNVSTNGADSAHITVSGSVRIVSMWVQTQNPLGAAVSATFNQTLSDIVMPSTPVLGQPQCSSRECIIRVEQSVRTQHLEIQYKTQQQTWTTNPGVQTSWGQVQSISSLEPYSLYYFRGRSKFSTGLWSQWSPNISSWTQEEAPIKELDVWCAPPASGVTGLRVYWKGMNESIARGKIIEYIITVHSLKAGLVSMTNSSDNVRNVSVRFCADCEVTVRARNSKGLSPPAKITTHHTTAKPPLDVQVTTHKHSVTISWSKPETAPLPAAYVVEWYPVGHKLQELRWFRLGGNDNHVVITDVKPFECYEGAVHVLLNDSSVTRTRFGGFNTLESAPTVGPSVQVEVEGNKVKVTWLELPRSQRGGCNTKYTIYLEDSSGSLQHYSVQAPERTYVIRNMLPSNYKLWMTAWTARGEGPAGQKIDFLIKQDTYVTIPIVCAVASMMMFFVLCLCQSSAVKQRVFELFQCFMLDVVPDPKNSKWVKECTQEKGQMSLNLQLTMESVTEDEPILVDIEEMPKQSSETGTTTNISSQLLPLMSHCPESEPATLLYPLTMYIKSLSQDSDSSDHIHTSLDRNKIVDYISTHQPGNMDEEDQLEEEEDSLETLGFFPSNIFMEPLQFGGNLTLDAVKIDCSSFFQNI